MQKRQWECLKCENTSYETDQLSGTGGMLSKFFNIQNRRFTTVSCSRCRYTELYKGDTGTLSNILDFFGN